MVKTPAPQKNIHKMKKTKSDKRVSPSKSPTQNSPRKNENAKPPKKSKKKKLPLPKVLAPIQTPHKTADTPYVPKK